MSNFDKAFLEMVYINWIKNKLEVCSIKIYTPEGERE